MKHLLDIPDLPAGAFRPVAGRMRLFGKSDAPKPPDYVGQAQATAEGNLALARAGASANRINQQTPYGSISYTRGTGIDQDRYNRYLAQQADLAQGNNTADKLAWYRNTGNYIGEGDWIKNPDQWSSTIELSPQQQALQNADFSNKELLAWLSSKKLQEVGQKIVGEQLDVSDIPGLQYDIDPATGMAAWDRATDLIRQRQNPELDRQQAALDAKLANMGLTAGSEGWQTQQGQFGKTRADADIAANLAGLGAQQQFFQQALAGGQFRNQARQQGVTERVGLRQVPLQELQALRSGAGFTNPTFSQPGQQQLTAGADLAGASGQQYNAALGRVNAENAQAAGTAQAGVGLIAAAAAFY